MKEYSVLGCRIQVETYDWVPKDLIYLVDERAYTAKRPEDYVVVIKLEDEDEKEKT